MLPTLIAQLEDTPLHHPRTIAEWRSSGVDYAVNIGIDVGGVLIAVFLAWLFVRFIAKSIERWGDDGQEHLRSAKEQRARTAAKLVRSLGRAILTIVAVLMILNQFGFNMGPLLASAGVVGLAVSFGSQSLVRDFVTGFFLQLEHQFALGDVIRIGTTSGVVENITLRLVYLRDSSGALHIIPNGQITQVTNLTRSWGRVWVDVDVPWKDSDRAMESIARAAKALEDDPAFVDALLSPPQVAGIEKIAGGAVTLRTVARIDPYRRDDVARALRERIKQSLDEDGIATFIAPLFPVA